MINKALKQFITYGLPYLLIELFYTGMPVVQMDSRQSDGVRPRDYQIFLDG